MASPISKSTLEHLAKLARIELDPKEEEKLLKDLGEILEYFAELQKLETANVPPMAGLRHAEAGYGPAEAGGTDLKCFPRRRGTGEYRPRFWDRRFPRKRKWVSKNPSCF